jgi:ABC-type branched-subunit amino acid transport system ATPase component
LSASENYLLQAKDVTVRFGGLTAVDAVSMNIAAGELVGIMGPNGAGKTTFFNAISGVTPLTSGQLKVDGRSLTGALPHQFAKRGLARTFQTPRVFSDLPVSENIRFGLMFAGRRPRKYVFWGEEKMCLGHCAIPPAFCRSLVCQSWQTCLRAPLHLRSNAF